MRVLVILMLISLGFEALSQNEKESGSSGKPATDLNAQALEKARKQILDSIRSGWRDCSEVGDLVYDFSCKRLYQLEQGKKKLEKVRITKARKIKIWYGKEVRFSVINVNRYLYDINFAADDVEFGSEPSPLFESAFLGKALPASGGEPEKPEVASLTEEFRLKSVADHLVMFKKAYDQFSDEYNKLIDAQLDAYSYCAQLGCNCGKTKFSALVVSLDNVKKQYIIDSTSLAAEIKTITGKASPTAAEKVQLQIAQEALRILNVLFEPLRSITRDALRQLVLFSNNQSRDHLTYIAPPIYPRGNRLELGFSITGKKATASEAAGPKPSSMPLYADSLSLDLPVRGKFFVSFSTGLFAASADRFKNANYGWQAQLDTGIIDDDSQFELVEGKRSPSPVGFAAFANLGTTTFENVMLAASLGVGLTVEDKPRTAYLGGFTVGIGDKSQFNFTAGILAMKVREFNNEVYTVGTLYAEKGTIDYREELETGWFVAITYSLFTPTNRKGLFSRSN